MTSNDNGSFLRALRHDHLSNLGTITKDMGLLPLPEEVYPRLVTRPRPDRGYYVALGVVMMVWMITPLSCAYLIWYALYAPAVRLTGTIFAAYALTEVVFAMYQQYLIHFIQIPAPPSRLPLDQRHSLFIKVLQAGLAYPDPIPPALEDEGVDPLYPVKWDLYKRYVTGELSVGRYHHLLDSQYERDVGMTERRQVAMMTQKERGVIDAFVGSEEERERRLREEVECDLGAHFEWDEEDNVVDRDGNVIRLHQWDKRAIEFRERLRTWFDHAPWESLKKDNILIWLSFSCFNLPLPTALADPTLASFLSRSYDILEARTGSSFPPGFDPSIRTIRLTLDPVNARSRPLILYAVSNAVNHFLTTVNLPSLGMGHYTTPSGIEYLIRIPPDWTSTKKEQRPVPVMYLHGLGFGLSQNYLTIKYMIERLDKHPMIIPLAHHTAQSVFNPRHLRPWSRNEFVSEMKDVCRKWGFWDEPQSGMGSRGTIGGLSVLSHSNGSVAHGWLLKDCPSLVRRSTFVDPVVFCLWEGDVCHSFIYRQPRTSLELLLYCFIASEIGIAHYIQRHFDWADNTLFIDEIPDILDPTRTQIFLGGKDIIVDAARVRRHLERNGMKVGQGLNWGENAGHGDGLSGDVREKVVRFVGTGHCLPWEAGPGGEASFGKGTAAFAAAAAARVSAPAPVPRPVARTVSSQAGAGAWRSSDSDSDRTLVEEHRKDR